MYAGQYVISADSSKIPDEFQRHRLHEIILGVGTNVTALPLTLRDELLGYVFGCPLDFRTTEINYLSRCDNLYEDFRGSFGVLLHDGRSAHLYLDPMGSLPAVYSAEHGVVAANPDLILDADYDAQKQNMVIRGDVFFPFGLTSKPSVRRLLPNHVLDFTDFTTRRHWTNGSLRSTPNLDELLRTIVERLEQNLTATKQKSEIALGLTGGLDSRVVLACMRQNLEKVYTFTGVLDDDAARDAIIAAKIADYCGVPYKACAHREPTADQRHRWLASTGYCVGGRVSYNFLSGADVVRDRIEVRGHAGEVGRLYYHRPTVHELTPEEILRRLHVARSEENIEACKSWREGLGTMRTAEILDLLYIEIRLGCWVAPQVVAEEAARSLLTLFNDRRVFEAMLTIPVEQRRRDGVPLAVLRRVWPEVLTFAYKPSLLARALRKLLPRSERRLPAQAAQA